MKSRRKRFFKQLFKIGKIPLLLGIGLLIGLAIGAENSSRSDMVIRTNGRFSDEIARNIEQHIEQNIQERINEHIVIPPIPEMPEMPEMPTMPDFQTNIRIERGPTFWEVLNGIGTMIASLMLIGLGGMILVRRRREPKEKSPESVGV